MSVVVTLSTKSSNFPVSSGYLRTKPVAKLFNQFGKTYLDVSFAEKQWRYGLSAFFWSKRAGFEPSKVEMCFFSISTLGHKVLGSWSASYGKKPPFICCSQMINPGASRVKVSHRANLLVWLECFSACKVFFSHLKQHNLSQIMSSTANDPQT